MSEYTIDEAWELAWAAGLFVGEGSVGGKFSHKNNISYEYLHLQISMMDQRSIERFAMVFNVNIVKLFLKHRGYHMYKVSSTGKSAEHIISEMWPFIEGTDKGDQVIKVCERLGIGEWVYGNKVGQDRMQCHNIKRGKKTNICGRVRQQFKYSERKAG